MRAPPAAWRPTAPAANAIVRAQIRWCRRCARRARASRPAMKSAGWRRSCRASSGQAQPTRCPWRRNTSAAIGSASALSSSQTTAGAPKSKSGATHAALRRGRAPVDQRAPSVLVATDGDGRRSCAAIAKSSVAERRQLSRRPRRARSGRAARPRPSSRPRRVRARNANSACAGWRAIGARHERSSRSGTATAGGGVGVTRNR